MKTAKVRPGRIWQDTSPKNLTKFLVIGVHHAGEMPQKLTGFEEDIPQGSAVVAEIVGTRWDDIGPVQARQLADFETQGSGLIELPRKGAPISYFPGTRLGVKDRVALSKATMAGAGGRKRTFNITREGQRAFKIIRAHERETAPGTKTDDTKIVNRLLIEEEFRIQRKKRSK